MNQSFETFLRFGSYLRIYTAIFYFSNEDFLNRCRFERSICYQPSYDHIIKLPDIPIAKFLNEAVQNRAAENCSDLFALITR